MDERQWNKAKELADAFGDTYSESVAVVLGSALMEALSELLDIPLEVARWWTGDFGDVSSGMKPSEGSPNAMNATPCEFCGGDHLSHCSYCKGHHPDEPIHEGAEGRPYPEFLEGEAAYMAAPVGTVVESITGAFNIERFADGWGWTNSGRFGYTPTSRRRVLQWGSSA